MVHYYAAVETRSHAFLLDRRLKDAGIASEIAYMPREIMTDLCNVGVMFKENDLFKASAAIRWSGLPGVKLYKQTIYSDGSKCEEVEY